jgi:two-component system sensor histidine kinase UhpB
MLQINAMTPRRSLSLRLRVLAAIALVVALGAVGGAIFAGWLTRQTLRDELQAAMAGGGQRIAHALADRRSGPQLAALIETFEGDRHVTAALVGADGRVAAASHTARSAHPAPDWFVALLDPRLPNARFSAGADEIILRPAPADDVGDAWLQFEDALLVLGAVGAAGALLVYVTIGGALRPLQDLSAAFARVGSGDYAARVGEEGPAELIRLAQSFNLMAGDLAAMRRRTRVLEEQFLKLQDEERAELARDLHDEIGPHLFAVNIDAAVLSQSLAAGRTAEAEGLVKAIQAAVGHMQREVRDILARLRPAQLVELGLSAAIGELVRFWRARRADIVFDVDLAVDDADLPETVQDMIYRLVQEALSNAVRHGQPKRIEIVVQSAGAGEIVARVSDDGAARPSGVAEQGFGLLGMRERVEAVGGVLSVGAASPNGWTVLARAPIVARALQPERL